MGQNLPLALYHLNVRFGSLSQAVSPYDNERIVVGLIENWRARGTLSFLERISQFAVEFTARRCSALSPGVFLLIVEGPRRIGSFFALPGIDFPTLS